ncbi:MAG: aromatic ring-hydroxylating dioxygenase subunit alpha [Myxococcota bacterium]|nr:aromatic ring-hydroxylating dioxygenase subunit alpha [Myxococcota bacterium]
MSQGGEGSLAQRLEELRASQPEKSALLQPYYRDPEIFDHDMERIHLSRWLCAGHVSQLSESGSWFRFDVAGESLIVIRGQDDEIRALVNVCRHRGSRVCYEESGKSRRLLCPYHGWTYDSQGRLISAPRTSDLDASRYSLAQVHCRVSAGLIFVCFAESPPDLQEVDEALQQSLGRYGWGSARVAKRVTYTVSANWKLVTENYQECYHCRPSHPEFARFHATERPDEDVVDLRKAALEKAAASGIVIPEIYHWPEGSQPGREGVSCSNDAMYEGGLTGSQDGSPVAPFMGDFDDYHGGFMTYLDVGPSSFFLAYPDHGVMYLFMPRSVQQTDMDIIWLVDGEAEEGKDYTLEELTWLWKVTSDEDKKIIEQNQQGVNSRYYVPGPYVPMEYQAQDFTTWYLEQIHR